MTPDGKTEDLSGKRAAITALFETHFGRITRYIAVRIGDTSMAEDLASEVFVRALRSLDSYKDTGAPMEAWVFRIANNLVIDHVRSLKRRPALVPLEGQHKIDDNYDPDDKLDHEWKAEELQKAMQHLSEAQRQVLALRFGGEMTSEQAAKVMGKNPGAVRQMQSDAIKKLKQVLSKTPLGQQR